jgi:hypothetical protein
MLSRLSSAVRATRTLLLAIRRRSSSQSSFFTVAPGWSMMVILT